jgi:polar amino acid transport system substrate-binding protein
MKRLFICGLLILIGISQVVRAETIMLVSQYDYAPWVNHDGSGLNALLAKRLSEISAGKYEFKASTVPRRRLDEMLASGEDLLVAWVHPRFFGDNERVKYLWSGPLLTDVSYYVSPASAPLEYIGPESLTGKKFSASAGHVYGDIGPLIDAGKVVREDAPTLRESLMKLVGDRGLDFAVVDRSTLLAMKGEAFVDPAQMYIAKKLRSEPYTRHILVPKKHPEWLEFINTALTQLSADKSWTAEMELYGPAGP